MRIDYRDGLLFVSLTLAYKGRFHTIDHVILDTGATQSLIDREAVAPLHLTTEDDDLIVIMLGIGGKEHAIRKQIDILQFVSYVVETPLIDFGNLEVHAGINGLLGADILIGGKFIIDLDNMTIYQRDQ